MPSDLRLSLTEHVPDRADGDAPLVVLVHGSLDRAGSFARVIRRLADLHTVAYDRRGYHRSRHVVPVHDTLDGHVDDLLLVIDSRPAVVIGHSYGGDIALAAALRTASSGHIRAVAAFEPPMPWLGSWATRPGTAGQSRQPSLGHDEPGLVAERFFRRMVGDSAWDRLPEATKEARRADGAALAAEIAAIRVTEAPFDVTRLTVPAVFGRGTDSLPHHRASTDWLVANVAESELVEIEGAAHGAHLTHPDAFAQFVRTTVGCAGSLPVVRPRPVDG
jgi:pimeloyl-ACP methyl ester carboxylesterase